MNWISVTCLHTDSELSRARVSVFDSGHEPQGTTSLLKTRWAKFMITFPPWGFCQGGTSPRVFHTSLGHAMQSEWHDIKALPHQDWKAYILFFCLQAVNYLTSTHNEQCKTSRNLIKRQRQGPSADGKWLTQLIKHPSVRLNTASLSHHLKYGWVPLHISIFPFPLPVEQLLHLLCWPLFILLLS